MYPEAYRSNGKCQDRVQCIKREIFFFLGIISSLFAYVSLTVADPKNYFADLTLELNCFKENVKIQYYGIIWFQTSIKYIFKNVYFNMKLWQLFMTNLMNFTVLQKTGGS